MVIVLARELLDRVDVLPGCSRLCAWACAAGGGPELPATVRHGCRGDLSRLPWVCCVDSVVGCCVAGDPKAVGSVSDEGIVRPCSSDQGSIPSWMSVLTCRRALWDARLVWLMVPHALCVCAMVGCCG